MKSNLYDKGVEHRTRALENTSFTHVHSVDIEASCVKNFFEPAMSDGDYRAAIECGDYYMAKQDYTKASACYHSALEHFDPMYNQYGFPMSKHEAIAIKMLIRGKLSRASLKTVL